MLDEKARELGRLIGQSPEYQAVKRANEALNGDRDAVALLRQMDQLRDQAQGMIERPLSCFARRRGLLGHRSKEVAGC